MLEFSGEGALEKQTQTNMHSVALVQSSSNFVSIPSRLKCISLAELHVERGDASFFASSLAA